jgi:hypothetical protein
MNINGACHFAKGRQANTDFPVSINLFKVPGFAAALAARVCLDVISADAIAWRTDLFHWCGLLASLSRSTASTSRPTPLHAGHHDGIWLT